MEFSKPQTVNYRKVSNVYIQLLEALDYLQRKSRIVHRDIKADNILIKHDIIYQNHFAVKITDFGLARRLPRDSDVITCGVEGAPLYLAPEAILGDSIGPAVDMWACGVILFLLLAGYPPFWHNDDRKLMLLIVEGHYNMAVRYWDQVSDDATDLVKRMLVLVHSHKRVTAFKALNHPWITNFAESEKERMEHNTGNFVSR
ncbi:calcium/calmodulin-dependent protein kinase type II subunit delta-like [Oculina patagonica]